MDPEPEYDARYLAGIDHFNRDEYFEAHEVWEDLWHECGPADRLFVQSLIQAAVALYHWGNGNRAGARRLFASGRDKMAGYRPSHWGLDVDGFWRHVEAALAGALTDDPPPPGGTAAPAVLQASGRDSRAPRPRIALHHGSDHDR